MVVGFCGILLVLFVPETFWDRAPAPRVRKPSRPNIFRRLSSRFQHPQNPNHDGLEAHSAGESEKPGFPVHESPRDDVAHVGFAKDVVSEGKAETTGTTPSLQEQASPDAPPPGPAEASVWHHAKESADGTGVLNSTPSPRTSVNESQGQHGLVSSTEPSLPKDADESGRSTAQGSRPPGGHSYTRALRDRPAKSFVQQLRPYHGRLNGDKWLKIMIRPFILFSYPAVLWSTVVYSCSVGWLIVISESVAVIYRDHDSYNFNALQTGLIYISPFIGGLLGTAVAGKVSDIVVQKMAARNGGLYEPEFRLVMAIPVALTTVIGLMGFGWSAQVRDNWIVPTVFFGIISFGCSLGSTTAITFCVDSYRQYAGEALVTLNFSKNVFHGLVFSLFVTGWIQHDGSKMVFVWIGIIQLILLLFTIPMYCYGKRARMWTVRKNLMEKF